MARSRANVELYDAVAFVTVYIELVSDLYHPPNTPIEAFVGHQRFKSGCFTGCKMDNFVEIGCPQPSIAVKIEIGSRADFGKFAIQNNGSASVTSAEVQVGLIPPPGITVAIWNILSLRYHIFTGPPEHRQSVGMVNEYPASFGGQLSECPVII